MSSFVRCHVSTRYLPHYIIRRSSTIRIYLENTSSSPVDFVKLTFSDMHTTATQAYVDEQALSAGEVYELESDNLNRPVFTWIRSEAPFIAPGTSTMLEVQCLGKLGW